MAKKIKHAALERAITQLGVTEHPAGSNDGPEIRKYRASVSPGLPPGPWCMYFVHWCFAPWVKLGGWGSVQAFTEWVKRTDDLTIPVGRPLRGDIVAYDWDGPGNWYDHVGIVEKVLALRWRGKVFAGWVQTVEGNTSVGNDSNGGMVMRRRRWIKKATFARVIGKVPGGEK